MYQIVDIFVNRMVSGTSPLFSAVCFVPSSNLPKSNRQKSLAIQASKRDMHVWYGSLCNTKIYLQNAAFKLTIQVKSLGDIVYQKAAKSPL